MKEAASIFDIRTQTLLAVYAAINRNDIAAAVELLDPDFEWIEPPGFPTAGIYRGRAAVLAHLSRGRNTWAEGTCAPQRFLDAGDNVFVFAHVHVRLNGATDWIDAPLWEVYTFRAAAAVQMHTFNDRQAAFAWAGIDDPDVN